MNSNGQNFKLPFKTAHVASAFAFVIVSLVTASLVSTYYRDVMGGQSEFLLDLVKKFDLDLEANNIPTWYQSMTLALTSFLLITIALIRKHVGAKDAWFFTMLGAGFIYMSMDEAVSIHEHMTDILRHFVSLSGIFYFAWVVPGLLIVATVGVLSLRTLFKMTPKYRYLMMASGFIYLMGAIGIEMLGGRYYEHHLEGLDASNMTYNVITGIEETFEMSGIAMFITTLLSFIRNEAFAVSGEAVEEGGEEPVRGSVVTNTLLPAPSLMINFASAETPSMRVTPLAQHQFSNNSGVR